MDNRQKILIKLLIATDDFKYIYDEKDVQHSDPAKINNFFIVLKQDFKASNLNYEEKDLKKMWRKIREKFVKINLAKARFSKITKAQENFYNYYIFLEDYIHHKNADVYKTKNKKEILLKIYNEIVQNIYENEENLSADSLQEDNFNIDDLPDASSIFDLEYEEIEMLDEYRDIVQENLNIERNKNIHKHSKIGKAEIVTQNLEIKKKNDLPQTPERASTLKKPVKHNTAFSLHASIIAPMEPVSKGDLKFGSSRAKHEQLMDSKKEAVVSPIVAILNEAVLEQTAIKSRTQVLQTILASIKNFCVNLQNATEKL